MAYPINIRQELVECPQRFRVIGHYDVGNWNHQRQGLDSELVSYSAKIISASERIRFDESRMEKQ